MGANLMKGIHYVGETNCVVIDYECDLLYSPELCHISKDDCKYSGNIIDYGEGTL